MHLGGLTPEFKLLLLHNTSLGILTTEIQKRWSAYAFLPHLSYWQLLCYRWANKLTMSMACLCSFGGNLVIQVLLLVVIMYKKKSPSSSSPSPPSLIFPLLLKAPGNPYYGWQCVGPMSTYFLMLHISCRVVFPSRMNSRQYFKNPSAD